jgi:hypothetical protein
MVLFITLRPLDTRLMTVAMVALIFIMSILLKPFSDFVSSSGVLPQTVVQFLLALATVPAICLLDYYLRQHAQYITLDNVKGRQPTYVFRALFVSIMAMLLVSLILDNLVLLFAGVIVAVYLLAMLLLVIYSIPRLFVDVPVVVRRTIAGNTVALSLFATNRAPMSLYCRLSPVEPWSQIAPQRFILNGGKVELSLSVTPPLAGPLHPQFRLAATDSRGLIQVDQTIEPVELQVIPRARYAQWLAIRYLEKTGSGTTAATTALPEAVRPPRRGVEYLDSRSYQPGDELRNIDWKHTLKLNQLIIKEYIEAGEQSAIVAVNLSVADAEEADKLAFNLITSVLTLAGEIIPTALAIYDQQEVVLTTIADDPREILKQALSVVKDITTVEFTRRHLQLPDIAKLRRNISHLTEIKSEPGQRLLDMLKFEYQAIEQAAKNHPATRALLRAAEQVSPPAIIVLLSQSHDDAEALLVTGEKLAKRGFTTVKIGSAKP